MPRRSNGHRAFALLVVAGSLILAVMSLGHAPATKADPTTTTRPAHHRVTQQADAPGSREGASLGEFIRDLFGGDPASPTTTTRRSR